MTVDKLIEELGHLKKHGLSGNAVVKAWDADSYHLEEVSGFTYDAHTIELCTDVVSYE